jgi:hypothetical protein
LANSSVDFTGHFPRDSELFKPSLARRIFGPSSNPDPASKAIVGFGRSDRPQHLEDYRGTIALKSFISEQTRSALHAVVAPATAFGAHLILFGCCVAIRLGE